MWSTALPDHLICCPCRSPDSRTMSEAWAAAERAPGIISFLLKLTLFRVVCGNIEMTWLFLHTLTPFCGALLAPPGRRFEGLGTLFSSSRW